MTRTVIIAAALAESTLLGGWTFDKQGAYCAFDRDYTNCGYSTLEACVAAVRGVGGNCRENPMYEADRRDRRPAWFR